MNYRRAAVMLALLSPVVNLLVLLWVSSRPEGTFHDQGALLLVFKYFPRTFLLWIFTALLSAFFGSQCPRQGPDAMPRSVRWCNRMLIIAGLCLSLLILMVR